METMEETEEKNLIMRNEVKSLLGIKDHTLLNFIKKGSLKVDPNTNMIYMDSFLLVKQDIEERRSLNSNPYKVNHHAD